MRSFAVPGADIEHPHGLHGESLVVAHGVQVLEVLLADVARDVLSAGTKTQQKEKKEQEVTQKNVVTRLIDTTHWQDQIGGRARKEENETGHRRQEKQDCCLSAKVETKAASANETKYFVTGRQVGRHTGAHLKHDESKRGMSGLTSLTASSRSPRSWYRTQSAPVFSATWRWNAVECGGMRKCEKMQCG